MVVVGGYHSEGSFTDPKTNRNVHYDNVQFGCFADKWPAKIGLDDTTYIRFGTPFKVIKVPTAAVVSGLGLPFSLGESSRDVLKRFDFENLLVGGEILPVYDEHGKVESVVFSLNDGSTAEVSGDSLGDVSVENVTLEELAENKKEASEGSGKSKKSA